MDGVFSCTIEGEGVDNYNNEYFFCKSIIMVA